MIGFSRCANFAVKGLKTFNFEIGAPDKLTDCRPQRPPLPKWQDIDDWKQFENRLTILNHTNSRLSWTGKSAYWKLYPLETSALIPEISSLKTTFQSLLVPSIQSQAYSPPRFFF